MLNVGLPAFRIPQFEMVANAYQRYLAFQSRELHEALRHKKIGEEATELVMASLKGTREEIANEAADVVYHLLVGLKLRSVPLRRVIEVLQARAGVSGLDEKNSRDKGRK